MLIAISMAEKAQHCFPKVQILHLNYLPGFWTVMILSESFDQQLSDLKVYFCEVYPAYESIPDLRSDVFLLKNPFCGDLRCFFATTK